MEQSRPIWRNDGVIAWLLTLNLVGLFLPLWLGNLWALINVPLALVALWRWSSWRRRFKWLWTILILFWWVMILLFLTRSQEELDDPLGPLGSRPVHSWEKLTTDSEQLYPR